MTLSQLNLEPPRSCFRLYPSASQMEGFEDVKLGDLPEDIVRLIFEILVQDDKCRPTYAYVSKQIQSWYIRPFENIHAR